MSGVQFDAVLSPLFVRQAVEDALREDMGRAGDITTNATIPADAKAQGEIGARSGGTIAGLAFAEAAFKALDKSASFEILVGDGQEANGGDVVARITAHARALLSAERVALNYLCHLSGIATLTRSFMSLIEGTGARVTCTRKTTPGLRAAEKYAVRAGGGINHRFGLDDAVLIKDNHIAVAGSIGAAIDLARAQTGHLVKIEVEVDTLEQLKVALMHPIDAVLLDNMSVETLSEAVRLIDGRVRVEASGGVSLQTVLAIAQSGVDLISVGALTHSAPALDLGLDITIEPT